MKGIKKEFIVLGVIIVLLMAYLLVKRGDKLHYDIPKLSTLAVETLDKIEIVKPDGTITLVQKDKKWLIAPKDYPMDETKVKNITDTVSQLALTDLVSKAKNYSRYHLHKEKAITVKAYQKEKIVRDFLLGKAAATYGHTFVKIKDNDNVYHAGGSFRNYFDVKIDDLRDKNIMKVDQNEITELTVTQEGKDYLFARKVKSAQAPAPLKPDESKAETVAPPQKPEDEISWLLPDGQKGDKSKLDSLIGQFSNLTCQKYIQDKSKEEFKSLPPLYVIKLKGSKDFSLTLFNKIEEGDDKGNYPVISSESPYPFLLGSYKAEQIMKKPGELLEKKEEVLKK
jgi:Domain of unknown function (DUF4340)